MPRRFQRTGLALVAAGVLALGMLTPSVADQPSPAEEGPDVTGPIPWVEGDAGRNHPFLLTDADLDGRGYVAEEFFYSGTAQSYDLPMPSPYVPPPSPTAGDAVSTHPYKTRMMVYRPRRDRDFNGTVLVEWDNSSSRYDNNIWWQRNSDYIMREGYAYVGIAANHYAVHGSPNGLANWSPERYGSLSLPLVKQTGNPADPFFYDDQLSYDVFAQGLQAVRSDSTVLGGLDVETVIAGGLSRSAGHLGVFANSVNQRDPVADGIMLMVEGGQLRDDINVPVMKVLGESEYTRYGGTKISMRQPDSESLRTWWVTGTSHADHQGEIIRAAIARRDLGTGLPTRDCTPPTLSRIENHLATNAATEALVNWIRRGTAPARSPLPRWTPAEPPFPPRSDHPHAVDILVEDEHGNTEGGIRLPSLAVPTSTDKGVSPDGCDHSGVHVPFSDATLEELYPSHSAYVRAYRAAARRSVDDGFLLPEDARDLVADAQRSLVGTGLRSGPLTANVSTFGLNPSTTALRAHTRAYQFRGGEALLAKLDRATRLLGEGYTASAQSRLELHKKRFQQASDAVHDYAEMVQRFARDGRIQPVTAELLVEYAELLEDRIANVGP
jgi:hypothetical protein